MDYWKMQGAVYHVYHVGNAWQRFNAKHSINSYKSCEGGYEAQMSKKLKDIYYRMIIRQATLHKKSSTLLYFLLLAGMYMQ
jgi:hypothetical protein